MPPRVVIVGGGMVGLAFAIALAQTNPGACDIRLLEARGASTADPNPMDSRASALSLASVDLLTRWGVWPQIAPHAALISKIHISNQRRFGSTEMCADDIAEPALGYVAENHLIGRALLARAAELNISLRAPCSVKSLAKIQDSPGVILSDGSLCEADLVIIAEGSDSRLRQQLGIDVERRVTQQTAAVLNVTFLGRQTGTAFERFTQNGPLAMLPLPTIVPNQARFNVVWSMDDATANSIREQNDDTQFMADLQVAFGWRLGAIRAIGQRSFWPLTRVRAREQGRPGYLVVGNAAHGIHPVAGQGFNLSLRDAEAFGSCAQATRHAGYSLASGQLVADYSAAVSADQALIVDATDLLATLFNRRGPLLDLPRDAALIGLDLLPPLRRHIARLGTGLVVANNRFKRGP